MNERMIYQHAPKSLSNTLSDAMQAGRVGQVEEELRTLHAALEECGKLADELSSRLKAVSRQGTPHEKEDKAPQPVVPVAARIANNRMMVLRINEHLRLMLDLLEI